MQTNKKIVIIGGGTGQAVFLRGLKNYTENITAVVAVTDNGSSSGMLREDLGMLPPGDIRSCILALADTEPTMQDVFQYRFDRGRLQGQCLGNLFIAAMSEIFGSTEQAIAKISEFLAVKGKVLPVSLDDLQLSVKLKNGKIVTGESGIKLEVIKQKTAIDTLFVEPNPKPYHAVLDEIYKADAVVIGPGSLYTSVLANLVIPKIADVLRETKAKKFYVANLMSQPGETDGYEIIDYLDVIKKHVGDGIIDTVVANHYVIDANILKEQRVDDEFLKTGSALTEAIDNYGIQDSTQLLLDDKQKKEIKTRGIEIVEENLIEIKKGYIRHNAQKLSETILNNI